jgi:hypothetical protein
MPWTREGPQLEMGPLVVPSFSLRALCEHSCKRETPPHRLRAQTRSNLLYARSLGSNPQEVDVPSMCLNAVYRRHSRA